MGPGDLGDVQQNCLPAQTFTQKRIDLHLATRGAPLPLPSAPAPALGDVRLEEAAVPAPHPGPARG